MNRWLVILFGSLLVLLTGCGGGSSDTSVTARTGTVVLTFTDAPSEDFQHINIEVSGVQLLGGKQQVTLFDATTDGGNRIIDLLALQAFSEYFAVKENVPAGTYNKIRLYVDNIELVKTDDNGKVIDTIYPDVPANGKIDLNPRGSFELLPGKTLQVQLDIDANKSIKIHQTGNSEKYKFRPVVFIDVINNNFHGRLVRIHGRVDSVDTLDNSFVLCPNHAIADDALEHCVHVNTGNASLFDSAGLPVDVYEYSADEELTAIGFLVRKDDNSTEDNNSETSDDDDKYEHRTLNAEVIELDFEGRYEIIKGKIASEPTSEADQFELNIMTDPVTGIIVQLQAGTKVFNKQGVALDYTSIQLNGYALVDGVLDATNDGLYNAALVVIDTDEIAADVIEKISGEVLTVDTDNSIVTISTDTGDLEILVDKESTHIIRIDESGGDGSLSEATDLSTLTTGELIEAYGEMNQDGYFHASIIVVSDTGS